MKREMRVVQLEPNLAFEIGLRRIATVVDSFYCQMMVRSDLKEPFCRVGTWAEHKARMTYFWWVALGGNPGSEEHLRLIDHQREDGFDSGALDGWMQLFAKVVHANLKRGLAEAWIEQAEFLRAVLLLPPKTWSVAASAGLVCNSDSESAGVVSIA